MISWEIIAVIVIVYLAFNTNVLEPFISSNLAPHEIIPRLKRKVAYLNGGSQNLETGVVERVINGSTAEFSFELHLPETQPTYKMKEKANCGVFDNCHWDTSGGCGEGANCLSYDAFLVDDQGNRKHVGKPRRHGDGVWRLKYTGPSSDKNYRNVEVLFSYALVLNGAFY